MKKLTAAGLLVAATLLGAPSAAADPEILDPYCTGGQEPVYGQCKPLPTDPNLGSAGLDPDVAMGLDPELFPAV